METIKKVQKISKLLRFKITVKVEMFFCAAIIFLSIFSCSKAIEKGIDEITFEDILVEESPWTFSKYQNSFIEDDGGSGLDSQAITDDLNQYLIGVSFTFNADGTGYLEIPEQERKDWAWTLSDDRLKTVSDSQTDRYTFFNANRNQMTFESRTTTLHMKDSIEYNVTHVGKYFFD